MRGYLGMGFDNKVGNIYKAIRTAWGTDAGESLGHSFLSHLFELNSSLPNNFDIQLSRVDPLTMDVLDAGSFVIGGHAEGYEDVVDAPKLRRIQEDYWSILIDEVRVGGEQVAFVNKSSVMGVPDGKLAGILDTGLSLPGLPEYLIDAIYGSQNGAEFFSLANLWVVPCGTVVDLSFILGYVTQIIGRVSSLMICQIAARSTPCTQAILLHRRRSLSSKTGARRTLLSASRPFKR